MQGLVLIMLIKCNRLKIVHNRKKALIILYCYIAGLEVESAADLASLHQIKSQILWLERSLQRRTKELETLYVFDANLSSPSEDISARDEMVNTPDSGRVDSPGIYQCFQVCQVMLELGLQSAAFLG